MITSVATILNKISELIEEHIAAAKSPDGYVRGNHITAAETLLRLKKWIEGEREAKR